MSKQAGLWIDHREAIIVILAGEQEELKQVISNHVKHVRYSGRSRSKTSEGLGGDTPEDQRDWKFANQLNAYYDEVIAAISDVDTIQVFGPGEAKGELQKRIEHKGLKAHILALETVDKMMACLGKCDQVE